MRFERPVSIKEVASLIDADVIGEAEGVAHGINELHKVEEGDLVFVDHPKYFKKCIQSAASYIIINEKTEFPPHKALLLVDDPFEAYLKIVDHYHPFLPIAKTPGEASFVGEGTVLMPGVVIGNHVSIGKNCVLYPNVVVMDYCIIGNNVTIQAGSVIGSDAFYYNKRLNRDIHYKKMVSCGRVIIDNNVEIGANCTIDRGVTSDTVLGAGTKLDNLVHIGHDTIVGKNCLFAAQVAIAGATTIEDDVILWGQVGVSKTLTIEKGVEVYAQSGVGTRLEAGKKYFGSPVEDAMQKKKELVWVKRIPLLWEKVMGK